MATEFEMQLCGSDPVHLQSVAFQVWGEVDRLERMMSMHDPRAEVARINREAFLRPVRVEVELFNILVDCQRWNRLTEGYFDIAYSAKRVSGDAFILDASQRTILLTAQEARIDLGGYGKGYALDRIRELLSTYGVLSALIHGGTSSILALGAQEDGSGWNVAVGNQLKTLCNESFSFSAIHHENTEVSDVHNPHKGSPLAGNGGCWVTAPCALDAEVLTTACLAMGRERGDSFFRETDLESVTMGWVLQ